MTALFCTPKGAVSPEGKLARAINSLVALIAEQAAKALATRE